MPIDKLTALQTVRKTLSADYACNETDFDRPETTVREAREVEGRRRFRSRGKRFGIVSLGVGVVVCCEKDRMEWAANTLGHLKRDVVFSGDTIAVLEQYLSADGQFVTGPDLKYVCSSETFRPATWSTGEIEVSLLEADDLQELYSYEGFGNALGYRARNDKLATVARRGAEVVGIAGASADSDSMWQIGIDVVESARGLGLGKALTGTLTRAILDRDKVPYYSTSTSNIPSRSLAIGVGFWPSWVEVGARTRT